VGGFTGAEAIFLDVQNAATKSDELTRTLAFLVTQARMHAIAEDRAAGIGSIFYAFPQAARTLARK